MNFYNKDRKYRRLFRNIGRRKNNILREVIFIGLIAFMLISLSDGTLFLKEHTQPDTPTILDTHEVTSSPGKDTSEFMEKDIPVTRPSEADKSAYFPDHTPAEGEITDGYGPRTDPEPSIHYAVDIASVFASPVYAAADGEVLSSGSDEIYGLNVIIDHIYDGYKTKYAHLCAYVVTPGQKVKKGDMIGFMGSTGYSTGVHLHFEVIKNDKRLDPAAFIRIKNGRAVID
ncbi:MAG: M23 family metallopeptidase [Eubacteriaceae bacterium]|nr:M23 family metallopeptidase [Eubacteriaceae bacterium]